MEIRMSARVLFVILLKLDEGGVVWYAFWGGGYRKAMIVMEKSGIAKTRIRRVLNTGD